MTKDQTVNIQDVYLEGYVYVDGTFTMQGNASVSDGGGVFVNSGTFTLEGGTVYGSQVSGVPEELANTALYAVALYAVALYAVALYVCSGTAKDGS